MGQGQCVECGTVYCSMLSEEEAPVLGKPSAGPGNQYTCSTSLETGGRGTSAITHEGVKGTTYLIMKES